MSTVPRRMGGGSGTVFTLHPRSGDATGGEHARPAALAKSEGDDGRGRWNVMAHENESA